MAIPANLSEVPNISPYIQYVAGAGQTLYPYPFPITQDSDLVVVINGVTLGTNAGYTLTGQGDDTGGDVILNAGSTAGDIVTLYRDIAIERITQFSQNSGFSSAAFNAEFNNLYLIAQQLESSIAQCLQIPNTNNPAPVTVLTPSNYANKYLSFDAFGNPQPAALTSSGALTRTIIGSLLYPQTPAEVTAGVAPTNMVYPELDIRRYGAQLNGTADDHTAIAAAITVAGEYSSATIVFPQNATIKCGSGITWDITKVRIDLNGAVVSFATMTTGVALTPTVSQTTNNVPIYAAIHPFENGQIVGPGVGTTAVTALSISDAHGTPNISGLGFRNIAFVNFATDVSLGAGSFCIGFDHCVFTTLGSGGTTYSVIQQSNNNSGERQMFRDCFWYNKAYGIHGATGSADIFLIGCSIDGCTRALFNDGGSSITMIGGHIEGSSDTDNWVYATSTNSAIILKGVTIVLDANKTAFPFGYSDSTCTNGGVFMDDCSLGFGAFTYTAAYGAVYGAVLIGGTGNAAVRNLIQQQNGNRPATASSLGLLAYPGFESANFTAEWTVTLAARSTTQKHTGTESLALTANSGSNASASVTLPCKPGQYVQGSLWMLGLTIATQSATLQLTYAYLDKGGNTIGSSSAAATVTTNIGSWANFPVPNGPASPAPFGTASVTVGVSLFNATSACIVYVDDVLLNVV